MMDQLNPRARRDRYGSRINRDHSPLLAYSLPWATIIMASVVPAFFVASAFPYFPPLGLLVLIGWRLIRPGLLPIWAGFPLGLWDDLFSGQPFGSAILLWSLAMLVFELIESRFPWRGFAQDWASASVVTMLVLLGGAVFSGAQITLQLIAGMGPQLLLSVLFFPFVARVVARLDRLRLMRFRTIG
ncbi:MAG: rod shape-determining protein MreD [Sphingomonadaceae bacterium]